MSGEGSLPGLQMAAFSLCPHRMGVRGGEGGEEQALAPSSRWWATHPIMEAPKAPPPDTITAGIQFHVNFVRPQTPRPWRRRERILR